MIRLLLLLTLTGSVMAADPVVIAHRGASGYLPEHSLAAYAMAWAQGADFLEPDIVLTRDDQAIALHDLTLDGVSNVRERFSGRARDDGLHYAIDFTLDELRTLELRMRVDPDSGEPVYPQRMSPSISLGLRIVTLSELIELTQSLNRVGARQVGIYPELKFPGFHSEHGKDITRIVLDVLHSHGYRDRDAPVFIQCFEPGPLLRLRDEFQSSIRRVQLLGENAWMDNGVDYEPMYSAEGLDAIAEYADAIGPPIARLFSSEQAGRPGNLVRDAHARGLAVHPFTFRSDALPPGIGAEALLRMLIDELRVDGLFTDQTDVMRAYLQRRDAARE